MRTIRTLALTLALPLFAAPAFAEDAPSYYEDDTLHFEVADSLLVTRATVRRTVDAEGHVDVITIRAIDPRTQEPAGESFAAITVFHRDLPVPSGTSEARALGEVVGGIDAAFAGNVRSTSGGQLHVGGASLAAEGRTISTLGGRATFRAAVLDTDGGSIVFARFDVDGEALRVDDRVFSTFALGAAPAPTPDDGDEDAADEPHEDDDSDHAGEDDHAGHDHDHDHDH